MIDKELEKIMREQREKNVSDPYIRNILKEYLQVYVLYFIYTSPRYKQNLLFTGGTCLRHFYDLPRLSEDLDFDYIHEFDSDDLKKDLESFFKSKYKYSDLGASLKQKGKQVLLKFPVLKKLGLAKGGDSDFLYVKIDLSKIASQNYTALITTQSSFGMNYAARHYDLPSLMSGKLHAILKRKYIKENAESIKGRDYFDLLWFVKKGVIPNLKRLSDMLDEEITMKILESRIDEKVGRFIEKHKSDFEADMKPFLQDFGILKMYVDNYRDEYSRFKGGSFS